MEKNTRRQYSAGFKERVIQRIQEGERAKPLSMELLIPRSVLYRWREEAAIRPGGKNHAREKARKEGETEALEARIGELEAALGRKTLEMDFFQGALRRFEASGAMVEGTGAKTSRPKSAAGWNRKAD